MSDALPRARCSRRLRGRAPSLSPAPQLPPSQLRLNLGTITMNSFRQLSGHCRVNLDRSECVYPKRRKVEEEKGGNDGDEIVNLTAENGVTSTAGTSADLLSGGNAGESVEELAVVDDEDKDLGSEGGTPTGEESEDTTVTEASKVEEEESSSLINCVCCNQLFEKHTNVRPFCEYCEAQFSSLEKLSLKPVDIPLVISEDHHQQEQHESGKDVAGSSPPKPVSPVSPNLVVEPPPPMTTLASEASERVTEATSNGPSTGAGNPAGTQVNVVDSDSSGTCSVEEIQIPPSPEHPATESPIPSSPPPKASPLPPPPKDELTLIAEILEEVKQIEMQVDDFKGSARGEKEYRILDGRLTICLDHLDKIESNGREDVRSSRKECIRYTQSCIDKLEEKIHVVPSTMEEVVTIDDEEDDDNNVETSPPETSNSSDSSDPPSSSLSAPVVVTPS